VKTEIDRLNSLVGMVMVESEVDGLADTYSERDLETAVLRELEAFLLEIGTGFASVARQKRITVDDRDYSIDLLFYHRHLRRLVAIELKLDSRGSIEEGGSR